MKKIHFYVFIFKTLIDVHSTFLYCMWFKSHVDVGNFEQITTGSDIDRVLNEDLLNDERTRASYLKETRPMIVLNAMNNWKCWAESKSEERWSVEQWLQRFPKVEFKVETDDGIIYYY